MKKRLNRQGVPDINPTNKQPNGRRDKQHQFEDVERQEFDADGQVYVAVVRCCKHCSLELKPYHREMVAHLQIPCRPN
jgi:hypothetical protein